MVYVLITGTFELILINFETISKRLLFFIANDIVQLKIQQDGPYPP